MKSLIILLVDNGETTDGLDAIMTAAQDAADVLDWTARVDIPAEDRDYTFRVNAPESYVMGLRSRDRLHSDYSPSAEAFAILEETQERLNIPASIPRKPDPLVEAANEAIALNEPIQCGHFDALNDSNHDCSDWP